MFVIARATIPVIEPDRTELGLGLRRSSASEAVTVGSSKLVHQDRQLHAVAQVEFGEQNVVT